jgi:hypothetical protein
VTPEEFRTAYPKLRIWIEKTLAFYEKNAQPVISMHFMRLPLYFGHRLLEIVKFVAIDRVPMPPLTAMGLSRFAAFEQGNFDGITYEDRYFIKRSVATEESLHFHELIHVIQWRLTRTGRLSCSLWKTPTSKPAAVSHHCGGFSFDAAALCKKTHFKCQMTQISCEYQSRQLISTNLGGSVTQRQLLSDNLTENFEPWQEYSVLSLFKPTLSGDKGNRVASILPFIRLRADFDDEATRIMGEAFDAARASLQDIGQPQIVYEIIAKRIIEAAKKGERDPTRLRDAGLAALGYKKDAV